MTTPAATQPAPLTFRDVLGRISSTVMSVVFFAQLLGLVLSGLLAQLLGIRLVFLLCAVLAWVLAAAGRWLLSVRSQQPLPA